MRRKNIYDIEKLPVVLDVKMVAALLRCSESLVKQKARSGEIPGFKFGKLWRFNKAEITEIISQTV